MTKTQAIKYFETDPKVKDGVRNLASALGISHQAIYRWPKFPPRLRQLEIQEITGGALRAHPRRRPTA